MAALMKYTCNLCRFSIESWSDGASYIQFPHRKRQYFGHPLESLAYDYMEEFLGHEPNEEEKKTLWDKYISHEGDYICKKCLKATQLDPDHDPITCKYCKSVDMIDVYELTKTPCFKCNRGHFDEGKMIGIS